MKRLCAATFLIAFAWNTSGQILPYKNPNLAIDARVIDLLSRMTPEEKFWQLFMIPGDLTPGGETKYNHGIFGFQVSAASASGGASAQMLRYGTSEMPDSLVRKINTMQRYFVERTRLGIPIIAFDEALHGLVRDGATTFPASIGLAATWDTTLVSNVAKVIATETKIRGIRQILSPVVNIASDVRWGRTEETYGEDPFLTSEIGVAFVRQFENMGVITTPKHFVANVGEGGRDSYPIQSSRRQLEELYFPPFKALIQRGGSRSIMTSYNSLDGVPCSANDWLLNTILKGEWGFKGFVISDAGGVGGANVLHYTAKDYPDAGRLAVSNGLDVLFQTSYDHFSLFIPPFLDGTVNAEKVDQAVARVLRAKFELGLFEHPYADETEVPRYLKSNQSKQLALDAARKSIVLLKNENHTLPIGPSIKSITVIGPDAIEARPGGYSGPGNGRVSILEGIRTHRSNLRVEYVQGCGRENVKWMSVPESQLFHQHGDQLNPGLKGEYFPNINLTGRPAVTRVDSQVAFGWTLFSPDPSLPLDFYSVRWTGKIQAPQTGKFNIGMEGNDGYRLWLDGKLLIDQWSKTSYTARMVPFTFEKGKIYEVKIEFYEPAGNAHIRLVWDVGVEHDISRRIGEAVEAARKSDLTIIVGGVIEGEFQDRASIDLPGSQNELISAVAAEGKPVVVLMVGGSAVTMNPWFEKVNSILEVWYSGDEGGHAVADVLFGDYNPAGRLPITFPVSVAQLPLTYFHLPTGRGDDYNNLTGLPLFPFGYGLSYSKFEYSDFRLDRTEISKNEKTMVRCKVKNVSDRNGEEVIQLYTRDLLATVARPLIELKGFQRLKINAGETREVSFEVTPGMLSFPGPDWKPLLEEGEFRIMLGASSRDLRLKGTLIVK